MLEAYRGAADRPPGEQSPMGASAPQNSCGERNQDAPVSLANAGAPARETPQR
jgi:hypothetical protein